MKNLHIFRGYDIRGLYPQELNKESVYEIGKGYATFLVKRGIPTVVVGKDCRNSGEILTESMVKALTDSGINVYYIGYSLSPLMYFAQYMLQSKGGVMVTGSHNPKEFNGLKLASGYSETLITEEIDEVKNYCIRRNYKSFNRKGKKFNINNVFEHYIAFIKQIFFNKLKFKIVIDTANSTPGLFAPKLFRELGCEVIEQNTKIDGSFPLGTPDPTEEIFLKRLSNGVLKHKADIGFSYDSDGDRLGVVDDKGGIIWNDVLVGIFASDVINQSGKGTKIVYNVLCSKLVEEMIKREGGEPIIWKTGHSFIKEKVKTEKALFGGELSGHFFFMDNFFGHDDAIFASLRLLKYLDLKKEKLSSIIKTIPSYKSSPEIKFGCPENVKFKIVNEIFKTNLLPQLKKHKLIEIDGVRAEWETGMVVLRASQNGPYITLKFETKTEKEYLEIKKILKDALLSRKEVDFKSGVNIEALD